MGTTIAYSHESSCKKEDKDEVFTQAPIIRCRVGGGVSRGLFGALARISWNQEGWNDALKPGATLWLVG
jgi:hypothetical protein